MKSFPLVREKSSPIFTHNGKSFVSQNCLESFGVKTNAREIKITISKTPFEGSGEIDLYFGREFMFISSEMKAGKTLFNEFSEEIWFLFTSEKFLWPWCERQKEFIYKTNSLHFRIDTPE